MAASVKIHPPFEYGSQLTGTDPGTRILLVHAFVSLNIPLTRWSTDAVGKVQLVRLLKGPSTEWRMTSIQPNLLRPLPPTAAPPLPSDVPHDLESWIARWSLTFYRQPDFGLISELCESRESFNDRVARRVKPLIQKELKEIEERPAPLFSYQRKKAEKKRAADHQRVTGEGLLLTENVEGLKVTNLTETIQGVELGLLLVVPGTKLPD